MAKVIAVFQYFSYYIKFDKNKSVLKLVLSRDTYICSLIRETDFIECLVPHTTQDCYLTSCAVCMLLLAAYKLPLIVTVQCDVSVQCKIKEENMGH